LLRQTQVAERVAAVNLHEKPSRILEDLVLEKKTVEEYSALAHETPSFSGLGFTGRTSLQTLF